MKIERTSRGWVITSGEDLADEVAAAITFRAEPEQVVMGEYVEVVDPKGIRIGHLQTAVYRETAFGPAYVVCGINLR